MREAFSHLIVPRMPRNSHSLLRVSVGLTIIGAAAACRPTTSPQTTPKPAPRPRPIQMPPLASLGAHRIVPAPVSVTQGTGAAFAFTATTTIAVPSGASEVARVGEALATQLRTAMGFRLPVTAADGAGPAPNGAVVLRLGGPADLGSEGYDLTISADSVRLVATTGAGLFHGVQTLRQLLPAAIEAEQSSHRMAEGWSVPAGRIVDRPRFAWRGAMLDVARHFFSVDEVEQYIDLLALYKLNTLHLHLSDDQGWRI